MHGGTLIDMSHNTKLSPQMLNIVSWLVNDWRYVTCPFCLAGRSMSWAGESSNILDHFGLKSAISPVNRVIQNTFITQTNYTLKDWLLAIQFNFPLPRWTWEIYWRVLHLWDCLGNFTDVLHKWLPCVFVDLGPIRWNVPSKLKNYHWVCQGRNHRGCITLMLGSDSWSNMDASFRATTKYVFNVLNTKEMSCVLFP